MSFFKDMDLYKGVILASLILLPAAGWMIRDTQQEIDKTKSERSFALRKTNGLLTDIGELKQQIQTVENNRVSGSSAGQHKIFFQGQILKAARDGKLGRSDFRIGDQKSEAAVTGGSSKQRAKDFVVSIDFEKEFKMSWEFLFAVVFNCESAAGARGQTAMPSIWKLRKLDVRNTTYDDLRGFKTPPQPFNDSWIIRPRGLEFARREPSK